MENFGFYLVMTNPAVGYERCCEAAVRVGVGMVQLRMKDAPREEVVATARRLRAITAGTATNFIVNDDPSVAAEVGADGVHVGQSDMPVAEVRRLYPSVRIVGLSTHNPAQALASVAQRPDYIGVGPVFATPTKKIPDPVLGVETAARMIASVPYPAVAIGGINAENLADVVRAGARNWSVVRAVCGSQDPYSAILRLREIAESAARGEADAG
jgi:thiamine-phosphate pyrophosphorylase